MQRYDIGSSMAFWAGAHKSRMIKSSDGDYVLHSEAQAEIARLQAEVSELKLQIGMCDQSLHASWNDAIEAAAAFAIKSVNEGGMAKSLAFFVSLGEHRTYKDACLAYRDKILSLKRPA